MSLTERKSRSGKTKKSPSVSEKSDKPEKSGCASKSAHKKPTITSGPLIVPAFTFFSNASTNPSAGPLNMFPDIFITIYIALKNPTDRWLSSTLSIGEADFVADTGATTTPVPTVIKSRDVTEMENHLGSITVAPRSVRLISFLPNNLSNIDSNRIIRVSATGDFAVGDERPKCGLLEIEVLGGISQQTATGSTTGGVTTPAPMNNPIIWGSDLIEAKFGDFVVCDPCAKPSKRYKHSASKSIRH